ncbi:molybdopterin molybdotransferase MoeA [Paracoccus aminophilus]|uniref:Molybdopterin molybdenumtransferase n=1 Tax=Paracoccus aminophilus JCM 7686 TaxID=1367847 RepID=S5Y931_PARAH|nr:molybdopterin molybdotransferase MoeA [Paracoccus aminophilus]AGT07863.1 molybdopterin biosynthesis protein, MoeA [Paracoccus aminophilus JCM 7686]
MITVDDATALVLGLARPPVAEEIAIGEALGRVMIAPAVARLTQPPFDSAAMDGYALRSADLPGPLEVIGTSSAGHPWDGTPRPGTAIRIFTGAPVPAGYDRVVMQEIVTREGDRIAVGPVTANVNIRLRGNDFAEGAEFLPRRPLAPSDLALLAAMNVPRISVARRPIVAVMAGGDELVRPGEIPGPGQIICSNDLAIAGLAREVGAEARILPIARDTEESLREGFALAEGADLVVTIGGASVGDHDLIAKVSGDLGMERAFYKLAMRPGKPLMAGRMGAAAMLGLPGNPVSSIVCAKLFMQPLLLAMQGLSPRHQPRRARLTAALPPEGDRQHYQRARLTAGPDLPGISAFADQDSARLGLLAEADALLIRPAHDPAREIGEIVEYLPLHG